MMRRFLPLIFFVLTAVASFGRPDTGPVLFSDEQKNSRDGEMLSFIETSIGAKLNGLDTEQSDKVTVTSGSIDDFRSVSPATPCRISVVDDREMRVDWDVDGRTVGVSVPIGYDTTRAGSRGDIENSLIAAIKTLNNMERKAHRQADAASVVLLQDSIYVLPGASYIKPEITENAYFVNVADSGETADYEVIWSADMPLESMADLFVYPSGSYGEPMAEVKVLKHEYGATETFRVPVNQLLAVFESEGCRPFWGVEKYSGGRLQGSLFMFNQAQGYDHVLKVECSPADVIEGTGTVMMRASLYIPTNNVDNLFMPYIEKSEDEKIRYKEN